MSRLARKPLELPKGVELKQNGDAVSIKGAKGECVHNVHPAIEFNFSDNVITLAVKPGAEDKKAMLGTTRVLLENKIKGVSEGFVKKLELKGVGYRAKATKGGKALDLTLGFSHPVSYDAPEGITLETPSQTEIHVKGIHKEVVGQAAAEIRDFRPPESYKGKGVRYADEQIKLKETKKK